VIIFILRRLRIWIPLRYELIIFFLNLFKVIKVCYNLWCYVISFYALGLSCLIIDASFCILILIIFYLWKYDISKCMITSNTLEFKSILLIKGGRSWSSWSFSLYILRFSNFLILYISAWKTKIFIVLECHCIISCIFVIYFFYWAIESLILIICLISKHISETLFTVNYLH